MDDEKREMLRERCVKEFGGKDGKEASDDETKVRQLFTSFMNKKTGRIGFQEAKDYTIMTEGDKAVLHLDMWTFVCKYAWKGLFFSCFSLFNILRREPNEQRRKNRRVGIQELRSQIRIELFGI